MGNKIIVAKLENNPSKNRVFILKLCLNIKKINWEDIHITLWRRGKIKLGSPPFSLNIINF